MANQVARGIVMICLGSLCFNLNDTTTKFLIDHYPISMIIFLRSVLALPLLVAMAILVGRTRVSRSSKLGFHAIRGALNLLAAYLYIKGLGYLSVAEATVILFALPLMVTAASAILFGEVVGWKKWAAGICSFAGVIIAIQPGSEAFQPASLFILAASVLYAANSVTARWLPEADNLWTVSFMAAGFSAIFVAPVAIGNWTAVAAGDLALLACAAVLSSLGIGLGSIAYRLAPASDLAPFGYSGLIWSLGITWIVWGTIPGTWTIAGALVVISSSIFYFIISDPTPSKGSLHRRKG
jgi:drug/metabolite transporter (DMT)-like permease